MARKKKSENVIDLQANMKLRLNGQVVDLQDVMAYIASRPEPTIIKRDLKGKPKVVREYELALQARTKYAKLYDAISQAWSENEIALNDNDSPLHKLNQKIRCWFGDIPVLLKKMEEGMKQFDETVEDKLENYRESNFYVSVPAI